MRRINVININLINCKWWSNDSKGVNIAFIVIIKGVNIATNKQRIYVNNGQWFLYI